MENYKLKEIIDYWYTIEFLNQPNYPARKDVERNTKSNTRHGYPLYVNTTLSSCIKDERIMQQHPVIGDTVEICIGKISRELCIKTIYNKLGLKDERIEFAVNDIAFLGLQISQLQNYIPSSFNISPLIWMITKLEFCKLENIADILTEKAYIEDMKKFNQWLSEKSEIGNKVLMELFEKSITTFIKPHFAKVDLSYQGYCIVQHFLDTDTKERFYEQTTFSNLHASYFAKDIKMVGANICHDSKGKSIFDSFLRPYVASAYNKAYTKEETNKFDILKETRETKELYESVMHINRMPLGKWPAKFSPSFMQQFAINQAIQMQNSKKSDFISVNGPPGTGKTTLLKEILADNIVKKALAMSKFQNSDDAFQECSFQYGNKTNHGYHEWSTYSHYYKIHPSIQQYALVVASCNNAAVENITKELPNGNVLCKNLSSKEASTKNDRALKNLHSIYENEEGKEIYYTEHAHALFSNSDDNDYYWGLISVPLGKRGNLGIFIRTLQEIFKKCMISNEMIESHQAKYIEAMNEFHIQFDKVENAKNKIVKMIVKFEQFHIALQQKEIESENVKKQIIQLQNEIEIYHKEVEQLETKLNEKIVFGNAMVEEIQQCEVKKRQAQKSFDDNALAIITMRDKIKQMEDKRTFMDYVFLLLRKETMRLREIKASYQDYANLEDKTKELSRNYKAIHQQCKELEDLQKNMASRIEDCKLKIANVKDKIETKNSQVLHTKYELANIAIQMKEIKQNYDDLKLQLHQDEYDSFTLLDDDFWNVFFSSETNAKTTAHLNVPWITKRYNRERERLFTASLTVMKEFVLSSKKARCNIRNLLMMWTSQDDKELVKFDNRDEKDAFPYLFQTLQAMIPLISTTFASVQQFLGNIEQPGMIGTLMIDEAGQAQPHMALGAMYRSKHVIAVGDPNQVEPVVTAELDAMKRLMKNETIVPYLKKSISVQELVDHMNGCGTYFTTDEGYRWVGSPLVVHRRCISPMFEISNAISYNNLMVQQTMPPSDEDAHTFALSYSQWVQIEGKEESHKHKNHFVVGQGNIAIKIIDEAFKKSSDQIPSLYVISPFKSVINGVRNAVIASDLYQKYDKEKLDKWLKEYCGSVHTFQGKEANEVIFILGCDTDARGSIHWVNENIINVAVSRAKYRLCIIGDYKAWKLNKHMALVKGIMDGYTLRQLELLNERNIESVDINNLKVLVNRLPNLSSFVHQECENDMELMDEENFLHGLDITNTFIRNLTQEERDAFHLSDDLLNHLGDEVRKRLTIGIKINQLLNDVQAKFKLQIEEKSAVNVMFCKAIEYHVYDCFVPSLKRFTKHAKTKDEKSFTLGFIKNQLVKNQLRLPELSENKEYDDKWWQSYINDLEITTKKRNDCCHVDEFSMEDQELLRCLLFEKGMFQRTLAGKQLYLENIEEKG